MNDFIRFCVEVFIGSISICALLLALNHSGWFTYHKRNDIDNLYKEWSSNPKFEQAQLVFCGNSHVSLLNDSVLEESLERMCSHCHVGGVDFKIIWKHLEAK
jgi:hypothetical protein